MTSPWLTARGSLFFHPDPKASPDVHVDLTATARCIAITGPSGSGKSTLLRALAVGTPRFRGTVRAWDETWSSEANPTATAPWHRRVGWVPQDSLLFPHLSVEENLRFSQQAGRAADIQAVLDWLDVGPLQRRRARNLSGGETQRVALGRALLSWPRVLLLDEPFTALPRAVRDHLARALREHAERHHLHLITVSHDDQSVRELADEVFVIEGDRIRRDKA